MAFPSGLSRSLIDQPQHAVLDKTAGFVPDGSPLQARLATAFRHCFGKEHNGTNDFVVMVNGIDEEELILRKILCRRHAGPPAPDGEASRGLPRREGQEVRALCRCLL